MNEQTLIKSFFDNELDVPALDGVPCKKCGKVPEIRAYTMKSQLGNVLQRVDRTSRIDCDASKGKEPPMLETYHRECWMKEVFND